MTTLGQGTFPEARVKKKAGARSSEPITSARSMGNEFHIGSASSGSTAEEWNGRRGVRARRLATPLRDLACGAMWAGGEHSKRQRGRRRDAGLGSDRRVENASEWQHLMLSMSKMPSGIRQAARAHGSHPAPNRQEGGSPTKTHAVPSVASKSCLVTAEFDSTNGQRTLPEDRCEAIPGSPHPCISLTPAAAAPPSGSGCDMHTHIAR